MSSLQQRGLALWAALLSTVVCLGFLPVSRWVSVLILLVLLGFILAFRTVARRREQHEVTLRLEDLPDATYRQPVVLVCGDLPLGCMQQSPVLTVTQGCWFRVEDHQDLAQAVRQILWLRPDWGRQLSVMVSVCPQQHPDSERLTSRLLTLRWHISQLRKATGHSVPLVLNGQVGSAMTNDMLWQAVFPGEGVRVWRESSAPGSVAEWVTTGGTPAVQQQVLMNSLMNWFRQHVQAVFMDENPDVPVIAPAAVLWGMGTILAGSLATSAWTTWLSRHTAMQQVSGWQPVGADSTVISLFPDFILPLLPEGPGLYQGGRLRIPVLEAIRSYVPPPPPPKPAEKVAPKIIRLDSMSLFDTRKWALKPGSVKLLVNSLVGIKAKPGWLIVVAGHTDSTGDDPSNQVLSLKRAKSVRDWMRDTGDVPESCFAVQGYGESRTVATNDTAEGRALNRRVEISLVPQANACQLPGNTPAPSQDDGVSKNEME